MATSQFWFSPRNTKILIFEALNVNDMDIEELMSYILSFGNLLVPEWILDGHPEYMVSVGHAVMRKGKYALPDEEEDEGVDPVIPSSAVLRSGAGPSS